MRQSGGNRPFDAVFLSGTEEHTGLFLKFFLGKLTFQYGILRFIRHTGTCIFILRQQFCRHFLHHLFTCFFPTPGRSRGLQRLRRSCRGNGNGRNHSLTGFHFRKIYHQLTASHLSFHHFLQRSIMTGFRPDIQIIDNGFTIHCHIKDTKSFAIGSGTSARTVPRLRKIELYPIRSVRKRELIIQFMTSETKILEEFPIARAPNRVVRHTLTGLIRREFLPIFRPRMGISRIVRSPLLTELIGISISSAIDTVQIRISVFSL